jgi:hypothetical protein
MGVQDFSNTLIDESRSRSRWSDETSLTDLRGVNDSMETSRRMPSVHYVEQ